MKRYRNPKMYTEVFFSLDGDFKTMVDNLVSSMEVVLECSLDINSRPLFYPLFGIVEIEDPREAQIHGILPDETPVVYFDLRPVGNDRYNQIVGELSKVLSLPMSISAVSEEIERIYVNTRARESHRAFQRP